MFERAILFFKGPALKGFWSCSMVGWEGLLFGQSVVVTAPDDTVSRFAV